MLDFLTERLKQGYRTHPFPKEEPTLPDRFLGRPEMEASLCSGAVCRKCMAACPTGAIRLEDNKALIDLGACIFCGSCIGACPNNAITFTRDYRLATRKREDLLVHQEKKTYQLAEALEAKSLALFGRSLKLRQVSAGGCGACEADCNVLGTLAYDLGRFGIQFVASPRHADGILITGPISENMRIGLQKTLEALATPKLIIAVGGCAIAGGPYVDHTEVHNGVEAALGIPVDLFVPGCPPHPYTILDGLLRLLGRRENP
jgi:Ni,Fe-hydrogenase III small subunit/ferredoxin